MIRPATPDDADALGRVHVQAWRETYPGIVPEAVIAARDPVERASMWRRVIAAGEIVLLAHDAAGDLLGFANAGNQREPEILPFAGEINAIYLLQAAKRRGIGRALMRATAEALLARGLPSASLWVLDGNATARAFYARLGGRVALHRAFPAPAEWPGTETAYAWDDLAILVR
jgi:GNAT superfamily N-acetyltransferase